MKILLPLMGALLICGCATTPSTPPVREVTRTFDQPYDLVWGAVISELTGDYPIQVLEKESGIIETQMVNFGGGFSGWSSIKELANEPRVFLSTWSGGARGRLSIYVRATSETSTSVRVRGHFEAFEDNVSDSWHVWPSKGVLENDLMDRIGSVSGLWPR